MTHFNFCVLVLQSFYHAFFNVVFFSRPQESLFTWPWETFLKSAYVTIVASVLRLVCGNKNRSAAFLQLCALASSLVFNLSSASR